MENIKQQLKEVIKKNLPEKKEAGLYITSKATGGDIINYNREDNDDKRDGFNQAISQINTSLIADEVLKFVEEEKYGLLKKYSQWLEKHSYMDCDWWAEIPCSVDRFLEELSLSPNKENKNNEILN